MYTAVFVLSIHPRQTIDEPTRISADASAFANGHTDVEGNLHRLYHLPGGLEEACVA